jgi:Prenyltransferase and squalene oxidase repeat
MASVEARPAKLEAKAVDIPEEELLREDSDSMGAILRDWIRTQAPWWAVSFTVHMVLLASLLLLGSLASSKIADNIPTFDEVQTPPTVAEQPLKPFEVGAPQLESSTLDTESLMNFEASQSTQKADYIDESPVYEERGGGVAADAAAIDLGGKGGFEVKGLGPGAKITGAGGIGAGVGTGNNAGSGGGGNGFGGRGSGSRKELVGRFGGTKETERAVGAALNWLARHQMPDGSWSLKEYPKRCKDKTCTSPGGVESFSGATALGLLPFLAAGQTHVSTGPYQKVVNSGIYWLLKNQKKDGDLSAGAEQQMYSHGLAAIALCEDYGMSHDKSVGAAAQLAINFIQSAQNSKTGGWRYHPGEEGDTSVVGWQLMALKSAQMAGLNVNPGVLDGTKRWLKIVAKGAAKGTKGGGGMFSYRPDDPETPSMSAVGLLCSQYLHAGRQDPVIVGGVQYLMANQPDEQNARNVYYWYYATQVLHNMADKDWDTWNRKMRKILVTSQAKEGCATGSWDPDKPVRDAWGPQGGRIMMTSLACLTLEVYYRYLPLYKLDKPEEIKPAGPVEGSAKSEGAAKAPAAK